jgi:predicted small metal-binding protein
VWYIYPQEAVRSTPEGGAVTKSFRCQDVGAICDAEVTGETEEEVLAKAVEHAKESHGVDLTVSRTLVKYAAAHVRDKGGGR